MFPVSTFYYRLILAPGQRLGHVDAVSQAELSAVWAPQNQSRNALVRKQLALSSLSKCSPIASLCHCNQAREKHACLKLMKRLLIIRSMLTMSMRSVFGKNGQFFSNLTPSFSDLPLDQINYLRTIASDLFQKFFPLRSHRLSAWAIDEKISGSRLQLSRISTLLEHVPFTVSF